MSIINLKAWHPESWQQKSYYQPIVYTHPNEVEYVMQELQRLPPLVTTLEIEALKQQLASATRGERFILQGGDCAETFAECNEAIITNKLRILLQMSLILIHGLEKPITRIGRMAGQYAKPRSQEMETIGQVSLPSYRGDLINGPEFSVEARMPDPWRMLQGHYFSALTLNFIRALTASGFADLCNAEHWELEFAKHAQTANEYHQIANSLHKALRFINSIGGLPETLRRIEFYTSHEALHLPYEQAMTRETAAGQWYNLSTHFPWIGARSAFPDSAHIEYVRGIRNPIACKVGLKQTAQTLTELIEILNPDNEAGRLTLIHRFGADKIADALPPLLEAVKKTGIHVLWLADPMHGNTISTPEGYKTRSFDAILAELRQAFIIHKQLGGHLGGVHFELTGENVTECIGGARGLSSADLKQDYRTLVDPRLNYEQALEMAILVAKNA